MCLGRRVRAWFLFVFCLWWTGGRQPESGTVGERGGAVVSTASTREDGERDSHHRDMTWAHSRNAWGGTGTLCLFTTKRFVKDTHMLSNPSSLMLCYSPPQGWSWWRPLSWRLWSGLWRRWRTQLRPPTALGSPWHSPHAATPCYPHPG